MMAYKHSQAPSVNQRNNLCDVCAIMDLSLSKVAEYDIKRVLFTTFAYVYVCSNKSYAFSGFPAKSYGTCRKRQGSQNCHHETIQSILSISGENTCISSIVSTHLIRKMKI